jgi:hypothetical protein
MFIYYYNNCKLGTIINYCDLILSQERRPHSQKVASLTKTYFKYRPFIFTLDNLALGRIICPNTKMYIDLSPHMQLI